MHGRLFEKLFFLKEYRNFDELFVMDGSHFANGKLRQLILVYDLIID